MEEIRKSESHRNIQFDSNSFRILKDSIPIFGNLAKIRNGLIKQVYICL
jgi:hypothetical protein